MESGEMVMVISVKYAAESNYHRSSQPEETFPDKDAFKELEKLIGLKEVKKTLAEVTAFSLIQAKRTELQLKADPTALHMLFKGNPGTGKTTVARILGSIFKEINILSKGHLVEAERADLVGEYIGHTAQKTKEIIKRSLGGIIFIDEAYTLSQGGEKDFGQEAIATGIAPLCGGKSDEPVSPVIRHLRACQKNLEKWFLKGLGGQRKQIITEMLLKGLSMPSYI